MHLAGREDFSFQALQADASSPTSYREFPQAKDQQTLEESAWKLVSLVSIPRSDLYPHSHPNKTKQDS